jgi:hypothetical protein
MLLNGLFKNIVLNEAYVCTNSRKDDLMMRPSPTKSPIWRTIACVVSGIIITMMTGIVENRLQASIIGATHYGVPLPWRITLMTVPETTTWVIGALLLDMIVWSGVSYVVTFLILSRNQRTLRTIDRSVIILPLFVVLGGFVMAVIHELGHAVWGTVLGGHLTFMQVAFFELYPHLAVTSDFIVGIVRIQGLVNEAYGVFLLGGSVTTNMVAWLLPWILQQRQCDKHSRWMLQINSIYGLLDLPFYVIWPQLGLRHWVILGGDSPEPLIGARLVGIPVGVFYFLVMITSLGWMYRYIPQFRNTCRQASTHLMFWREKLRSHK